MIKPIYILLVSLLSLGVSTQQDTEELYNKHFMKGAEYLSVDSLDSAMTEFRLAIKYGKDLPGGYYGVGVVFSKMGYSHPSYDDSALIYLKIVRGIDSSYRYVQGHIGTVYLNKYKYSQALKHFKSALRKSPENGEHHFQIALAYKGLEDSENTCKHYKIALSKGFIPRGRDSKKITDCN